MAVNVKSCYLFVLDNISQKFEPTDRQLDDTVDGAYHFLEKNIEKCIKHPAGRPATFKKNSEIKSIFLEYRNRSILFLDLATEVAMKRFDFKDRYEIFNISNLFLCEVTISEVEYVVGIELICKEEMVYSKKIEQGVGVQNNLTVNQDIVPPASLSNTNFFMIELDKMTLTILEKMISTVDDDTYLYADKILECDTTYSIKEVAGLVQMAAYEIVKENQLDKLDVMPVLRRTMVNAINSGEDINLEAVANEAFFPNIEAIQACVDEIERLGIKRVISNENRVKMALEKNMRLKTDTGIEIIVPIDNYYNKNFIEVLDTEEGRFVIQVKNIGNIENK